MICVTVFTAQYGIIAQTVFGILVCFVALVLQLEKKPYKSDLLDALETGSLICCITTLLLGILLVGYRLGDAPYSVPLVTVISVLVVLLHATYILCWFRYFVPHARQMSGQVVQTAAWLQRLLPKRAASSTRSSVDGELLLLGKPPLTPRRRGARNETERAVGASLTRLQESLLALARMVRTPRGEANPKPTNCTELATICNDDRMDDSERDRAQTGVC